MGLLLALMQERPMKGTLALDIDGTTTTSHRKIPEEIVSTLATYASDGWDIIFITGRPFFHCVQLFQSLSFPFYVAPQNGAALVAMPSWQVVNRRYLKEDILPVMDKICKEENSEYVIYAGLECHDSVFFRPNRFSEELRNYLSRRTREFCEDWQVVSSFDQIGQPEFASIKCFARGDEAERLAKKIEERLSLHAPVILDPYDHTYRVIQGTHPEVNKGQAARDMQKHRGSEELPLIVAGDDNNDFPLLEAGSIKIAMQTAPPALRNLADIVAPPAKELGLIQGLQEAMERI